MATQMNLVLRKKINDILYDLMVKTVTDQVYSADNKTLTTILEELRQSISSKAESSALTELENKFNALILDAPETYDTLKEIADYIVNHSDEYNLLVELTSNKVDKVEGKGLSTNDFTDELKVKLDALSAQAVTDEKLESLTQRIVNLENASGGIPEDLTAGNVKYTDAEGNERTVEEILNELTYVAVTVSVSSPTSTTQEKGASLTNLVINWTTNKDKLTAQSINGVSLDDLTQRSYIDAGPISANKTYTVLVNDGTKTASKSITFSFKNKVYYGVSTETDSVNVDSAFILALSNSKFVDSKASVGTISANAGDGQYIIYAQPASFAEPTFNIGGFDTTFDLFATIDFTNASGYTESYNVYKSGQPGLGNTSMTVK